MEKKNPIDVSQTTDFKSSSGDDGGHADKNKEKLQALNEEEPSPFLTPETTPTKEDPSVTAIAKEDILPVKKSLKDKLVSEKASTVSQSKKYQRKRGKGRRSTKKSGTSTEPSSASESHQKPKSNRTRRRTKDETPSHQLTEYFPVRRSDRRCKKDLEKDTQEILEKAILSKKEEGIKVVEIEGKGRGVESTKPFKRGDFIVEYAGDLINLTSAKKKEDEYSDKPDVGCYMYYFKHENKRYCVDATAESGRLGRLLNHSKSGNCKTKVVGIGNRPYLILIAARDIEIGEELLYDYGDRSKESLAAHPWLAN